MTTLSLDGSATTTALPGGGFAMAPNGRICQGRKGECFTCLAAAYRTGPRAIPNPAIPRRSMQRVGVARRKEFAVNSAAMIAR